MIHHLAGFWAVRDRADVVLLHYDDLQADLEGEMRRLAARLDIKVPDDRWPALVEAATFDEMRSRADDGRPRHRQPHLEEHRPTSSTGGPAASGEDVVDDAALAHYEARVRELAAPDLVAWLHRGTLEHERTAPVLRRHRALGPADAVAGGDGGRRRRRRLGGGGRAGAGPPRPAGARPARSVPRRHAAAAQRRRRRQGSGLVRARQRDLAGPRRHARCWWPA